MSLSTGPRPCLKRSNNLRPDSAHNVHFPPSPALTRTFDTHSPAIYDRSPIMVTANTCALPERGCPGRTYTLEDTQAPSHFSPFRAPTPARGHAHPRLMARQYDPSPVPPPLVPDLSSESDESDGFASPRPMGPSTTRYANFHDTKYTPQPYTSSTYDQYNHSIYPDASYFPPSSYQPQPPSPSSSPKSRRRHDRDPHRQPERDHRIRSSSDSVSADDAGYEDDRDIAKPKSPSRSPEKKKCSVRRLCQSFASSSFSTQDEDACLGGF